MLEFNHSLTGAFIAYSIPNPLVSLPTAFLSHFVLDLLPHWNPSLTNDKKKFGRVSSQTFLIILLDSFIGLLLGFGLAYRKLPYSNEFLIVIAGSFLAVLPDLVEMPYYFFNVDNSFIQKFIKFQSKHQFKVSFWPGIIFQIIFAVILLSLI